MSIRALGGENNLTIQVLTLPTAEAGGFTASSLAVISGK